MGSVRAFRRADKNRGTCLSKILALTNAISSVTFALGRMVPGL